jgi:hypothetical protein
MNNKKYRVVFLGLLSEPGLFQKNMNQLGVDTGTVEKVMREAPAVMKQGLSLGDARHYADSIQVAGGRVRIEEYGVFEPTSENGAQNTGIKSLRNFTMCPECGHKQVKSALCVKCGFLFNGKD